ncbi:MAG: T9SS type A sorting domain-containing protein [Bacteroidota bacterium]
MKNLGPLVRYLLMIPLFSFIYMGTIHAQPGCTFGWSADPSENAPFLPTVNLPPSLGSGLIPYMDVIISIESGCQERLEFLNIGFTPPGCNIIEYFNQNGEFIGVEDLSVSSSSSVIFDGSDLDGVLGIPGYPSGVNPSSTCSDVGGAGSAGVAFPNQPDYGCDYFPGNCSNLFAGAEMNTFIFFRSTPSPVVGGVSTYQFPGSPVSTYRALRIVSVQEKSPPVIMGPFDKDICATAPGLIVLDNGPSDIVGDPRYGDAANTTATTPLAGVNNTANSPTRLGGASANPGKIRALYCTESTNPYIGGPGSTAPIDLQDVTTWGPGTGYLDADADGNGIGDYPNTGGPGVPFDPNNNTLVASGSVIYNDFYDNFTTLPAGFGNSTVAMGTGNGNTVYNYNDNPDFNDAPDLCGGPTTVVFSDFMDFSRRGDIYGTDATDFANNNGRIRYCKEVERRWTVTDQFGNSAVWDQRIDIVDDYRNCAGGNILVQDAGSPHFLNSGTVAVTPQPTTSLSCAGGNIYTNNMFYATPDYTNTIGTLVQTETSPGATFNFPVFIYTASLDFFDCSEINTLDGFAPSPEDNCDIFTSRGIDDLFDYGGDGDFGDDDNTMGTNFFDDASDTPRYVAPGAPSAPVTVPASTTNSINDEDDNPLLYGPDDPEFYNYDLLKRWVFEDNCGFRSIAQRIYPIRDKVAPTVSSAVVTINGGGLGYTPQLMGETMATLLSPNIKNYMIPGTINIVDPNCMPVLDINTTFLDNCAANQFVTISYNITTVNNFGATVPVPGFNGVLFGGNTMIPLPVSGNYTVTISFTDPSNNVSNLNVSVTTSETDEPLNFNAFLGTSIGNSGTASVDYLDIASKDDIEEFLSNLCDVPNCIELVIKSTDAFGNPIEDRGFYEVELPNIQLAGLANNNDPSISFDCGDIGAVKSVSVEILRVTNCNFTTIPVSSTATSTTTLLETRTSNVTVNAPTTPPFSVSTTGVPASSNVASDGSISVTITPNAGTPTQLYDVTYTGPASGTVPNVNISNNPTVISGLPQGTYTIVVQGQTSCLTQSSIITLGATTPANVTLSCPTQVGSGPTSFTLLAGTGFNNITSLDLQVVVTGPAGVDIPSASLTGTFATNVNGQGGIFGFNDDPVLPNTYNVLISVPLGSGVSAAPNDPLISFQLDVPATANPGDVISVNITGSALQSAGFGSPSNSIPFSGANCNITVSSSSSGTLSASGQVMYMYCGAPVENVQVTLNSTNPTQTKFTDITGSYSFPANITAGSAVTITPTLTSFMPSGTTYEVDGADLSALLSLLNTATPISPYQLAAADINGDGFLTAADAQLLLLFINTGDVAFLNSWIFVDANQTLNPFVPTAAALLQTSFSTPTYNSSAPVDFIGVKPGDIFPDCTAGSGVVIRGVAPMVAKDRAITKGESYELDFSLRDFDQVKAFQTVLNFDPSLVQPSEVIVSEKLKAAGLTDVVIESSSIRLLGASADAVELTGEDALISVRFEAVRSARSLKNAFSISQESPSLIFNDGTDRYSLVLLFDSKDTTPSALEVYGSNPNPFNDVTSIQFGLSQSDLVQLTVTDITGRVVFETNAQFDAGQHQFELNAADLGASGILIYTIRTSDTKYSDKLLLVK